MSTKNIAIIGGGATGSTIAVQQIRYYQELAQSEGEIQSLHITILDPSGNFGPGGPYHTGSNEALLLNQPAYAMSPFPEKPDDFTNWLAANHPECDQDSFVPRAWYGEYLSASFAEAAAQAEEVQGLTVETITAGVDGVSFDSGQFRLSAGDKELVADSVIYAGGHRSSGFLEPLSGREGFFAHLRDIKAIKTRLDAVNSVGIIGTSATMMDVLAVLDQLGFRGQIYPFSRNGLLPWSFDPALHRQEKPAYELRHLTAENVKASDHSIEAMEALFELEITNAIEAGYSQIYAAAAIIDNFTELREAGLSDEVAHWLFLRASSVYGNPAPPERHAFMKRLQKEGRLKFVRASISEETLKPAADGFEVSTLEGETISVGAVFNGATLARNIFGRDGRVISPLLAQAHEKGWLRLKEPFQTVVKPGQQNLRGLFVNGPPTAVRWGMESFRGPNTRTARESVEHALELNMQPV